MCAAATLVVLVVEDDALLSTASLMPFGVRAGGC